MKHTFMAKVLIGILIAGAACANAQWVNQPDKRTPRTRDGKPNLSAPVPRATANRDTTNENGIELSYASYNISSAQRNASE